VTQRPVAVLIAGEGRNELGGWFDEAPYRVAPVEVGVLEMLLRSTARRPFEVRDGVVWKRVRKYRAGGHASAELRSVLALALMAREKGCAVLALLRDSDGDVGRRTEIEAGADGATRYAGATLRIAAGVPVRSLDAWILAMRGTHGTEAMSSAKQQATLGPAWKSTEHYVAVVESLPEKADLPPDAESLMQFLDRIQAAFG